MRLLATLALVLAASALAEEPAQAYLRAANKLYRELEYEKALDQLARARKVAAGVNDDVRISLWEGIVLSSLGKADDARAAFNTALALEVDAKLPAKVSPKVTAVFEELRTQAKKELARAPPPPKQIEPEAVIPPPTPPPAVVVPPPPVAPAPIVQRTVSPGGGARRLAPIPFVIGALGAIAGVVGAVGGVSAAGRLQSDRMSLEEGQRVRDSGSRFQTVGFIGLGIGVAGILTGTLMSLLGGPAEVTLQGAPAQQGAVVGLRIQLP